MTPLERARTFFAADRFATAVTGIEIDAVESGYAQCSLAVTESHQNAAGRVMGGVLFTLADFAFAVAANLDRPETVTLSSQITFLSPPRGDRLIAEARCVRQGHSTCYYQIELTDSIGGIVAMVGVSGFSRHA